MKARTARYAAACFLGCSLDDMDRYDDEERSAVVYDIAGGLLIALKVGEEPEEDLIEEFGEWTLIPDAYIAEMGRAIWKVTG